MEVHLDKRFPIAASLAQAWAVLGDVRATAACMPGAQITEQLDDTHFKGTVKTRVGPASLLFDGSIELQALEPDTHTLRLLGKGADKGGSSASMQLSACLEPDGEACVLAGQATVTVSGKLAQFGSRLLVPVSDALLQQFAQNFVAAAQAVPRAEAAAPALDLQVADSAEAPTPSAAVEPRDVPAPIPTPTPAPTPVRELNVFALLWTVIKSWFSRRKDRP